MTAVPAQEALPPAGPSTFVAPRPAVPDGRGVVIQGRNSQLELAAQHLWRPFTADYPRPTGLQELACVYRNACWMSAGETDGFECTDIAFIRLLVKHMAAALAIARTKLSFSRRATR